MVHGTLNPVLYRILDVTVRPCSEQCFTHLDSSPETDGFMQRSFANLEAHARNNSTGEKFLGSLSVDHNHNCKSKQNNAEWNSTIG